MGFSLLPLCNAGTSFVATLPLAHFAYRLCLRDADTRVQMLYDNVVTALQFAVANGISTGAVELAFQACGFEDTPLNRLIIGYAGGFLSLPMSWVTLRWPKTASGQLIATTTHQFWTFVSDAKVRQEVNDFLRRLKPDPLIPAYDNK